MNKKNILLDMDGVLSDMMTGIIRVMNERLGKKHTVEDYVIEYGEYDIYKFYGVSMEDMFSALENEPDFWLNLKPLPWAKELYEWLSSEYEVTIVTKPVYDPDCARQKLEWLKNHLGITPDKVFIGGRKHLMARNGTLIDDWSVNVEKFREAGGKAILIPSNWNALDLDFGKIKNRIETSFEIDNLFMDIKHLYR